MKAYSVLCLSVCLCLIGALDERNSTEIQEDDNVLILTKNNFRRALKQHDQLLVHFYAPVSRESLGSILEFRKAAGELKETQSAVRLGGIDVNKEKQLAASLDVTSVPSLRLYLSGDKNNPVYCPDLKSSSSILTWLKRRDGPSADIISDLTHLEKFMGEDELVVLGLFKVTWTMYRQLVVVIEISHDSVISNTWILYYLFRDNNRLPVHYPAYYMVIYLTNKDLKGDAVKVFYEVSLYIADLPFGVTGSHEISSKFDISTDTVLLIRKKKTDKQLQMENGTTKEVVVEFIRHHEMELVTEYNGITASKILNSVVLNHLLLFINKVEEGFEEIYRAFETTAENFKGKVLFVMVDVNETRNGRIMEYFRVRVEEAPLVRMVNLSDNVQYHLPSDQFDEPNLTKFCLSYLEGKAKPKLQSEPIPENWDKQPVKELVGMNFEKVAFNYHKNVIILFYAPWDPKSRAAFPLWEELARHFSDDEDIVVAKIDSTANDVNIHLREKYPSIKFFPAVYSERVVSYSDKWKLKAIVKFMEKEIKKAKKERIKEEEWRKQHLNHQNAAEKDEL